jgi:hypothetical protein
MVLARCGCFAAVLSLGCMGTITDGPTADDITGPGGSGTGGRGGSGGSGGTGGIDILPPAVEPCDSKEFTPTRVWRLSDDQYVAAVKDLIGGVEVPTILTPGRSAQQFIDFAELFEIGPATTSAVRGSINAVASDAVRNLDALLGCPATAASCTTKFIEDFASRAFRRPLEAGEKDGLKAVYTEGAKTSPAEGIRMVISAVLQSGSFLYRTELGKAATPTPAGQNIELTAHELASSLSFLFLNSIPDPELRASADDGSINKSDVFRGHVERLLKLPRVQEHLTNVYLKWMGLGAGLNADLAAQEMEFTPALKAAMEQEIRLFFKDLLGKGGTINDVLTSTKGYVDRTLATHMKVSAPAGATGASQINYPATERAGVLTLSGILSRYGLGHAEVFRGKFVRDEFLCQEIPAPPDIPEVEEEAKAAMNLPPREQAARRLKHSTCGACHAAMDPIGLAFDNYDGLGRHRPGVDSSGELTGAGAIDGPLKSAVDLGQRLARSPEVRTCVESKMLGYALGRMTGSIDSCELKQIDGFVTTGGGKLSDLMAGIVYSSAFRLRTGGK